MIRIKNKIYDNPVCLAPLAGYSDMVFRELCCLWGADFAVTEMVSAYSVYYNNKNYYTLVKRYKNESPFIIQLFGDDPGMMGQAASMMQEKGADCIDINLGCPVKKVIKQNCGSALLDQPALVEKIIKKVKKSISIPVSVKIRLGINTGQPLYADICKAIEAAGADFLTVHGRYQSEMFSGKVHYDQIEDICKMISIPVIGNGDITDLASYKAMMNTGCNGVMIGRGAIGNPWIFHLLKKYNCLQDIVVPVNAGLSMTRIFKIYKTIFKYTIPLFKNRRFIRKGDIRINSVLLGNMILFQLIRATEFYPGDKGVKEFRKHLGQYLKGLPNTSGFKYQIFSQTTLSANLSILKKYFNFRLF